MDAAAASCHHARARFRLLAQHAVQLAILDRAARVEIEPVEEGVDYRRARRLRQLQGGDGAV